jgi:hypothetical protein
MIGIYRFAETSPSSPATVASSQPVVGSLSTAGVAAQLDLWNGLFVEAVLQGATGGTLDVYIQNSPDEGATWYDYAHFAQVAAAASSSSSVFSVSSGAQNLTLVTVGKNLSPALPAGTVVGGPWGDRFRLVMVAGTGTTAGAPVLVTIVGQRTDIAPR